MIPFAIRFAIHTDLALNAIAAVIGPEHVTIAQQPIAQFGVLVTAGIILHETIAASHKTAKTLHRHWKRRSRRAAQPSERADANPSAKGRPSA
jgi:hypothetical protein